MTIAAPDLATFMACVVHLTREGIGFNADAETLTIKLTGAF